MVEPVGPGTLTALLDKSVYDGFGVETTLKRISCPVLLIHGDPAKGSVLTREQVEAIRSAIPDCVADLLDAGDRPRSDQPMKTLHILMHFLESL